MNLDDIVMRIIFICGIFTSIKIFMDEFYIISFITFVLSFVFYDKVLDYIITKIKVKKK